MQIAAERRGNDGAARLAARRGHTDTSEERMQRNLYLELRIERLKGCRVGGVIDGIEPAFFRYWRLDHGRVVGGIDRPEAGHQRADTLNAIHLNAEDFDRQRITR